MKLFYVFITSNFSYCATVCRHQNGRTTESCFLSAIGLPYRRLWSILLVYQNGIHCFIVRLRALLIAVFKWVHELNPCLFWPESPTIHAVSQCSFNQVKPIKHGTWWRHQMETFSALLAICAGNSPVPGEFPAQRPVTRSFDVFFDLRPNKQLSKQWWGWWFETPSWSLWRHSNVNSFV